MTAELVTTSYADLSVEKIRASLAWAREQMRKDLPPRELELARDIERNCEAELKRRGGGA